MAKQEVFKAGFICFLVFFVFLSFSNYHCNSSKSRNTQTIGIWHDKLPACPCENPDKNGVQINDGWAKDKGDINKYHKGATECFRSYPPVQTNEGDSGQQCCYDANGNLITAGSGAGTPDKESTCNGEDGQGTMSVRLQGILGHYKKDVKPWEELGGADSGWVKYNLLWKPDNRNKCR